MTTRCWRSLWTLLPLSLRLCGTARAEMSGSTSRSAGFFFGTAQAGERHNLNPAGQVDAILAELDQVLLPGDKCRLKQVFGATKTVAILRECSSSQDGHEGSVTCYAVTGDVNGIVVEICETNGSLGRTSGTPFGEQITD